MFCSHCGKSNLTDANYCHKCGSKITGNKVNIPDGETISKRASTSSATGNTSTPPTTFAQFRARKEDDRNKHFKKKDGKRVKLDGKSVESSEVKINIGIMILKDEALIVKRGFTLPLTVPATITYDDLLTKAVEKHHRFNKGVIKHDKTMFYYLLYGDKSKATNLPGCNEPFTLKRYKEEIDKAYTRITLYLCPCSDHIASVWNEFDCNCDTDGSDTSELQSQQPTLAVEPEPTLAIEPEPTLAIEPEPTLAIEPEQPPTTIEYQCPICFLRFPIQQIEEHADNCSEWLAESEEPVELIESSGSDVEELKDPEPDVSQHKKLLKEQIVRCAKDLSTEVKRVTVRRKFIWEDFKNARKSKIQPLSNLKVVFAGEPCIDDGGPKRELFSELLTVMQRTYFTNGYPVLSTMAINSGEFKLCGEIMGMSVMQGGPAPHFLSSPIVAHIVGMPLSTDGNKNHKYKSACESLSTASTDEQVKQLLTSDAILDILDEIGYRGIPQRETLSTVDVIVQAICIKDQLSEFLPALLQIAHGLEGCGLLEVIRRAPIIWKPVFGNGNSFQITADEFLEQLDAEYCDSQIKKDAEIDTFKFFCDAIQNIDGGTANVQLRDFIKWLTGTYTTPPLGFPKRFSIKFVHGCPADCACRPTASTCAISMNIPVHINNESIMNEMIASAVQESHGFGLI